MKSIKFRQIIFLLAFIFVALFLFSRLDSFEQSLESLKGAEWNYVLLAIIFSLLSFVFAGVAYRNLIFKKISLRLLIIIQFASNFANKLVPAGIGGITINARFLTKNRHNLTQASAIVATNNTLGFVAHMSLLLAFVLLGKESISDAFNFNVSISTLMTVLAMIALTLVVGAIVLFPALRSKLLGIIAEMIKDFRLYKRSPIKLIKSYLSLIFVTLSYTACLYFVAYSLGCELSVLQALGILTAGVTAASITPTPGGIGGVEAAMVASLSAAGVASSLALAVTLLYRLITYWLPIIPGLVAFQYSVAKKYL